MQKDLLRGLLAAAALFLCIVVPVPAAKAAERITLVFVGDTGTNQSGAPISPDGGYKGWRLRSITDALQPIRPWLEADLVVANLESVVTDRSDLSARGKRFVFQMHVNGARALLHAGINAFSTANNHALDFGGQGAGETLQHLEALQPHGLLAWPGVGRNRQAALAPHTFERGNLSIAMSSFGIGGGGLPPRVNHAGTLSGTISGENFSALTNRLADQPADLRILSVHYGQEFAPIVPATEIRQLRSEAKPADGISIIAGHHSHVARGIELTDNHLILYGLGNFLHFGMQNMGRFDICRDFGLLARVTLLRTETDTWSIETVEALPLTNMHIQTEAMSGQESFKRLQVLNYLGRRLDNEAEGAQGLQFVQQADGSGLWCAPHAQATKCANWSVPAAAATTLSDQIATSCTRHVQRGR